MSLKHFGYVGHNCDESSRIPQTQQLGLAHGANLGSHTHYIVFYKNYESVVYDVEN